MGGGVFVGARAPNHKTSPHRRHLRRVSPQTLPSLSATLTASHHAVAAPMTARTSRNSSEGRDVATEASAFLAADVTSAPLTPRDTVDEACGHVGRWVRGERAAAEQRATQKKTDPWLTCAAIGETATSRHPSTPALPRSRGAPLRTTRQLKVRPSVDANELVLSILTDRAPFPPLASVNSSGACGD